MIDPLSIPIFVVDDDVGITTMVKKTLEVENYKHVSVATSGKEALDLLHIPETEGAKTAQMRSVRLFVLDIILPDMNGLDLCEQIKEVFPESIVIIVSGFDIEDFYKKIIDSEADDFLLKPFNPMELLARIKMLVQKHNREALKSSVMYNAPHASSHQLPHIGDEIDGFSIIDSLGWGKSSVIYKVIEKNGRGIYALKLLTRYALDFKEVVRRFEHEVKIMSHISHPNVIKFYRMGEFNGCPYIMMDYMFGINLEEYIVTKGMPDFKVVFKAAYQLASALAAIHDAGIIHRDVKLKNVMIEMESHLVRLTDFGIAKWLDESPSITRDGFIVGTPIYMAPEVFRGENSTISTDIYSYGVTMYQFITGSPPFVAANNSDLYQKHLNAKPRPFSYIRADMPEEMESLVVGRCMGKTSKDRPASMMDVMNELNKINKKYAVVEKAM